MLVAYIGANGALSALAKDAARGFTPQRAPDTIYASPPPVLFWQREVTWREEGTIAWGGYDPFEYWDVLVSFDAQAPDNMRDPLVGRALASPELRSFARWSTMPMAGVERGKCSARVRFGDARYGRSVEDNRFARSVVVATPGQGC